MIGAMRWMIAGFFAALLAAPVTAQPQPPVVARPPSFSPYLNLLRGGINPAINYYGLVRPQQFFQQQTLSLQQQVLQNNLALQSLGTVTLAAQQPLLPLTGHPVVFNSHPGYFNNLPIGRGQRVGAGGSPAWMMPPSFGTFNGIPASSMITPGAVMTPGAASMPPGFAPRGYIPATTAPVPAPAKPPGMPEKSPSPQ